MELLKRGSVLTSWFVAFVFTTAFGMQDGTTSRYHIKTIAFYNLENLFDTVDDSLTYDDDKTPKGKDRWTLNRYRHKIANMAKVIALIGKEIKGSSPDIIGLCELENIKVLQDIFSHDELLKEDYRLIHYDSPDERGIDVALAYRSDAFIPFSHSSRRLLLEKENGRRDYTRDLLIVGGMLEQDELYILINHWPSRSGGESRSRRFREEAARLNRQVIDSIHHLSPNSNIIIMGDFNDNPLNRSIKNLLKTKGRRSNLEEDELFNPMESLYKKGQGSLGYRDQWHMFDQILMTKNLIQPKPVHYYFWKAGIFNPPFLVTRNGPYTGYPKRTYASGIYIGGYSDHFPVYVYLIKNAD